MRQSAVGLHSHHRGHHYHNQHAALHPDMGFFPGHPGSRHPPGQETYNAPPPEHFVHQHPYQHPHQPHQPQPHPHMQHAPPAHASPRPGVMQRPTDDPNHYDQMFHNQTRPERRMEHVEGNQRFQDYNLFAPKYQNDQESSGYGDTWSAPRARPRMVVEEDRLPTKRGQRVPFPARTAPYIPTGARPRQQPNITHSIDQRQITGFQRRPGQGYISPYQTNEQQIDRFNEVIDSMHLPEDMQRPMATRDMMKDKTLEEESSQSKRIDNYIADRQLGDLNREGLLTIGGSGTFEDMFY